VSSNGYPIAQGGSPPGGFIPVLSAARPVSHRYWLHLLLLVLTFFSTTVMGAGLAHAFALNQPYDFDLDGYVQVWHDPSFLMDGLPFSITLLFILLAHEFGHYLTARYYHVDASLPYFLPSPFLVGTFGAFIKIRSVVLSKRILFDIGVAGPIAGFVALLGPLVAGVSFSRVVPGIATHGDVIFGTPLLLQLVAKIQFPGVPLADISLHPVTRAAWFGLLATALNLFPIGQLDGGHIIYAFLGEKTKYLSRILIAAFIPMGIFLAYSWLFWALLLFFFGMRHPLIVDPRPVGRARAWLAIASLVMFVLSFTPVPVRTSGL
jgi:membrane-associated protease RseP (regulator of RpoE activity)